MAAVQCEVKGCRHKEDHTTRYHQCGTCGCFGHGRMECGDEYKINRLRRYWCDELPIFKWCRVEGCSSKNEHTTSTHLCDKCNTRGGCVCKVERKCPICRKSQEVDDEFAIFTDGTCCVCLESSLPLVLFPECRHAAVCKTCVKHV